MSWIKRLFQRRPVVTHAEKICEAFPVAKIEPRPFLISDVEFDLGKDGDGCNLDYSTDASITIKTTLGDFDIMLTVNTGEDTLFLDYTTGSMRGCNIVEVYRSKNDSDSEAKEN